MLLVATAQRRLLHLRLPWYRQHAWTHMRSKAHFPPMKVTIDLKGAIVYARSRAKGSTLPHEQDSRRLRHLNRQCPEWQWLGGREGREECFKIWMYGVMFSACRVKYEQVRTCIWNLRKWEEKKKGKVINELSLSSDPAIRLFRLLWQDLVKVFGQMIVPFIFFFVLFYSKQEWAYQCMIWGMYKIAHTYSFSSCRSNWLKSQRVWVLGGSDKTDRLGW